MPAYRKAENRLIERRDGVTTYRRAVDGHILPGLIGLEEHVLEPAAVHASHIDACTSVATLVLSGTVQLEPWRGEYRALGPLTSLVHTTVENGRRVITNPSDSDAARIIEVTVAGASRTSLSLRGDHLAVGTALVRSSRSFHGPGPGVVIVCDGHFTNEAVDPLAAGDWLELDGSDGDWAFVEGEGQLLVIALDEP